MNGGSAEGKWHEMLINKRKSRSNKVNGEWKRVQQNLAVSKENKKKWEKQTNENNTKQNQNNKKNPNPEKTRQKKKKKKKRKEKKKENTEHILKAESEKKEIFACISILEKINKQADTHIQKKEIKRKKNCYW